MPQRAYFKFGIAAFFLLVSFLGFGQRLYFERWDKNTSIPSQECYNVFQDKKGYIWFSTEQGFCRYDGTAVTVFDRNNGLPEGAVYSVAEDKKGRLFLLTSKRRILILENGRITEPDFSKSYCELTVATDVPFSLKLVNDRYLYINSNEQTYEADIVTNALKKRSSEDTSYLTAYVKDNQIITFSGFSNAVRYYPECEVKINGLATPKKISFAINNDELFTYRFVQTETAGKRYLLVLDKVLIAIGKSGKTTKHTFRQRILKTHYDKDGGIWIGFAKGGLHYYPDGNLEGQPILGMEDYSVSGIFEDSEHNIWCTTLERGLFFSRNKNILKYNNIPGLDKPVDMLKQTDGRLFVSGSPNEIVVFNGDIKKQRLNLYGSSVADIVRHNDKYYISGGSCVAEMTTDFIRLKNFVGTKSKHRLSAKALKVADRNIYAVGYYEFGSIDKNGYSLLIKTPERLRSCEHLQGNNWLIGGNGLFIADVKTRKTTKIPGIDATVAKIYTARNRRILITTKSHGLYEYSAGKVFSVNKRYGISASVLSDITEDELQTLWIGSNKGLVRILKDGSSEVLTTLDGLPSNEIYKLAVYRNKLFFSTTDGVFSLNLSHTQQTPHHPEIYFKSLYINGKRSPLAQLINPLKHNQNSLRIAFEALTFKSAPKLLYTLKGRDSTFNSVNGNVLNLENLAPGPFKLIVYAVNKDDVKSLKPVVIGFTIDQPFWTTWWFIMIGVLLLILLVWILIFLITGRIKSREAEKTRISKLLAESQLSALQSQMNPHFIFNAINSIQNYILKKNEKEAYDYLTKFSKLIRLVLNNSRQTWLSLHEELQTIRLYIELEQLRFKNSFEFELILHPGVDEFEMQIPAMLIQPFLENAIWHGLMAVSSDKKGKISLEFEVNNDMLIVTISDNGAGRQASETGRPKKTHEPVAMELTAQRLDIVKQLYDSDNVRVGVTDLFDAKKLPAGTKVAIKLPVYHE